MNLVINDSLLQKCLHWKTQNQNESFNGTIWRRVPKHTCVGLRQFELGVYDAVSHFNVGNKAALLMYEKLGMKSDANTISGLRDGNFNRLSNAKRQSTDNSRYKRRLARGLKKRKKDSDVSKEGKTYIPGQW